MGTTKKKLWRNPKYKTDFVGTYTSANGDRVLQLLPISGRGSARTYDSWQAAKRDGWEKVS